MINVSNLSVHFGERDLFDNITFSIAERDRIGLVGRNGAGKSTLMKVISGNQLPNGGGSVARPNDTTVGYLHQDMTTPKGRTVIQEALTAFDEVKKLEQKIEFLSQELEERTDYESDSYFQLIHDLTDANERYEIIGGNSSQADAERVLKGLGFKSTDMERLTDEFSGGWQMRIELAKMLLQKPNYLLLDEPTNHLDIESILWLERFLEDYPGALVLISHDKQFLDNVTKRTIEIELGKVYDYKASYSSYVAMRAERRGLQQNAYDNQQRLIAQREKTISRFIAKANKSKMAQSMQKQLAKMDRIEIDEEDVKTMNIRFSPAPRSGQVVVEAKNVSKQYPKLQVLENVDLKLDRGERIAFVGQNGQGKTTLAKILLGVEGHSAGDITVGHNVQIGYYAQNQAEALFSDMTVLQTMEEAAPADMRTKVRSILGAFMFSGDDADKKVTVLSGGERARLALAVLLLKPFNLLLLDEPTNHLDMISKEVLKNALIQYDGTLIVVSHDRDFLTDLTHRTIEFRDKKLYEYLGDVNYFLNKRQMDNMREVEAKTVEVKPKVTPISTPIAPVAPTTPVKTATATATPAKATAVPTLELNEADRKKLERVLQSIEKKIADLEKKIAKSETEMANPSFYTRKDADKLIAEHRSLKKNLETETESWENAMMALDK
jgi:ATP-binding cassette, subfamily F, member 3